MSLEEGLEWPEIDITLHVLLMLNDCDDVQSFMLIWPNESWKSWILYLYNPLNCMYFQIDQIN